jgi:hypothetical protein
MVFYVAQRTYLNQKHQYNAFKTNEKSHYLLSLCLTANFTLTIPKDLTIIRRVERFAGSTACRNYGAR